MANRQNKIYQHIDELTGGILKFICSPDGYLKLQVDGYMDLVVERLGANEVSLTHYYIQNAELIASPAMQIKIDFEKHSAEALTFQNSICFWTVYSESDEADEKLKKELNSFLLLWLMNLKEQGFYK